MAGYPRASAAQSEETTGTPAGTGYADTILLQALREQVAAMRGSLEDARPAGRLEDLGRIMAATGDVAPPELVAEAHLVVGWLDFVRGDYPAAWRSFQVAAATGGDAPELRPRPADYLEMARLLAGATDTVLGMHLERADLTSQEVFQGSPGPGWELSAEARAGLLTTARGYLDEESIPLTFWGGATLELQVPPGQPEAIPEPPEWRADVVGHYPFWTAIGKAIADRLEALTVAWQLTREPAYRDRAVDYLRALSEWQTWTDPEERRASSLSTCYLAIGVARAYETFRDSMTQDEREAVRSALVRHALAVFSAQCPSFDADGTNYYVMLVSALGLGGLVVWTDDPIGRTYVAQAAVYLRRHLDALETSDQTEGLSYREFALTPALLFADALKRCLGETALLRHPYLRVTLPRRLVGLQAADGTLPNFGDASHGPGFVALMRLLHADEPDDVIGFYLSRLQGVGERYPLYDLLSGSAGKPDSQADLPLELSTPAGWAALRTGWGPQDSLLVFKSSPSTRGHDHFDANSFVLSAGPGWLLTDPGYREYNPGPRNTFTVGSVGHNTVLVDGEGQSRLGGGQLLACVSGAQFDYAIGEAGPAYGGALERFRRCVVSARAGYFIVRDHIKCHDGPRVLTWLLHTDASGQIEVQADSPMLGVEATLQFSRLESYVSAHLAFPSPLEVKATSFPGAEGYGPYAEIATPAAVEEAVFLCVLAPSTASKPGPPLGIEGARNGPEGTEVRVKIGLDTHVWLIDDDRVELKRTEM